MFVELVDALRCTGEHSESHLVAAQTAMDGRHILDGILGCPVCNAEYTIRAGVADFGAPSQEPAEQLGVSASEYAYEALRCAALLDLTSPNGFVLLSGEWAVLAEQLMDVAAVHLVLLNPLPQHPIPAGVSVIRHGATLPFMAAQARGAALDASAASAIGAAPFAAVVRGGGRLVAPVETPLPADTHILASDERHWVAEVSHPALATITLRRARD